MWVMILLSIKLTRDNHVYWTRLSRYFHNSRWTKCLVFPQMATFFTVTYCCQWAINKKTLKSRRYEILDSLINGRGKKHTNHLSCLKSIPHALRYNCKREIVLTTVFTEMSQVLCNDISVFVNWGFSRSVTRPPSPPDTTKVVIDAMTHNYRFSFLCWHSVGIRKYFSHGKLLLPAEKNIKLWTIKFLLLPEYVKENWADSTCLSVSNDGSMAVQSTFGRQSKHSSSLPTPLHTNTYTPKYSKNHASVNVNAQEM